MTEQQIAEIQRLGIPHFLGASRDQSFPGNDLVIPAWKATYDDFENNGLSAFGNVTPKSNANMIDFVVVAFTSPGYPAGQGTYYAGGFVSIFSPPTTAPGTAMGFAFQSQQFTESDQGKTVAVQLQGYVNSTILFGFEKTIVISSS